MAARLRPRSLDEVVGQRQLLGPEALFRKQVEAGGWGSVILFGPPGCGKTTIARLLAGKARARFQQLHAQSSGVKEIRAVLDASRASIETGGPRTMLFVDELHRLHRGQQEVMLREIEEGIIVFVGATTANPFFALSSALLSRSQLFELHPLSVEEMRQILQRALDTPDVKRQLGTRRFVDDALASLSALCDGDARKALQVLEWSIASAADGSIIDAARVREILQRRAGTYDRAGDAHYDHASALIKSIRGSDPDASIYWLARMLEGGEDIRFLCRRLLILASEDIGTADPQSLVVATATMQACEFVGLPECQFALAQAVVHLACAPKSNACARAIGAARHDVREEAVVPVPRFLRDGHAPRPSVTEADRYRSPHEGPEEVIAAEYLGVPREYFQPSERGEEMRLVSRVQALRQALHSTDPE